MIKAADMMAKMGKRKFIEYATHSQRGERMFDKENKRRWGRVKDSMCEHGVWVVENYQVKECGKCPTVVIGQVISRDIDYQGFNIGLGGYIDGRSDFKRTVKEKGLVHIGDDRR